MKEPGRLTVKFDSVMVVYKLLWHEGLGSHGDGMEKCERWEERIGERGSGPEAKGR